MSGQATTEGRLAAAVLGGRGAAGGVQVPYLVLDLGRGRDPHQARCRRCRWRSMWRTTTAQAQGSMPATSWPSTPAAAAPPDVAPSG